MVFRTISTALVAGLLAGVCLFLIQRASTLPLIHIAETYENPSSAESALDAFAKEPLRSLSTLLGDVFVAIGFGLILTGIYAASGKDGWLQGLLFGLGGFATFHLAPSMLTPPALPGMQVAPLILRQTGWLMMTISAMMGLVLLFYFTGLARLAGILFFVIAATVFRFLLPISPATTPSHSLALLDRVFVMRTLASLLVFWLILGIVSGYLFARARGKAIMNPLSAKTV
jgi:cobalt transporter subunit CbtA